MGEELKHSDRSTLVCLAVERQHLVKGGGIGLLGLKEILGITDGRRERYLKDWQRDEVGLLLENASWVGKRSDPLSRALPVRNHVKKLLLF